MRAVLEVEVAEHEGAGSSCRGSFVGGGGGRVGSGWKMSVEYILS